MLVLKEEYVVVGKKTTICLLTLENGFEIVGTSSCVRAEDFKKDLGERYAKEKAIEKYEEFLGFHRQIELAEKQLMDEIDEGLKKELAMVLEHFREIGL